MNAIEILELISKGEGYHIEFKLEEENNEDFAKTIVCFANTDGGKLLVGVDKSGNIEGVRDIDKTMLRIDDIAINRCEPPVTIFQESVIIENKSVVVVVVEKGTQRPYRTKTGQYYVRSSNRCRQASREELLRIFQSTKSLFYDELPVHSSKFNDIDIYQFKEFLSKYLDLNVENEDDLRYYLLNFHLINENNVPTIAGMLFFGKEPQKFISESKIITAVIPGTDIGESVLVKRDYIGTIPEIILNVESFYKSHLKEQHILKDFLPETNYEIPLTALREAVVNALAHRDYTINASIRLIIFDDRVEIRSPGKLPNTVSVESMRVGGSHVLRNPTIYNLLVKLKMVTDLGSGVRRIIKLVKEHSNKEVEIISNENELVVKIPK